MTAVPFQFRTDIARTEYLSNADERLRWQASSLPADDLCTENAIMLKRFNRYELAQSDWRVLVCGAPGLCGAE